jgi:hypothetical protein
MRSRAVSAEEDTEVERGPCVMADVHVGEMVSQSAQKWLREFLRMGSSTFF